MVRIRCCCGNLGCGECSSYRDHSDSFWGGMDANGYCRCFYTHRRGDCSLNPAAVHYSGKGAWMSEGEDVGLVHPPSFKTWGD